MSQVKDLPDRSDRSKGTRNRNSNHPLPSPQEIRLAFNSGIYFDLYSKDPYMI